MYFIHLFCMSNSSISLHFSSYFIHLANNWGVTCFIQNVWYFTVFELFCRHYRDMEQRNMEHGVWSIEQGASKGEKMTS